MPVSIDSSCPPVKPISRTGPASQLGQKTSPARCDRWRHDREFCAACRGRTERPQLEVHPPAPSPPTHNPTLATRACAPPVTPPPVTHLLPAVDSRPSSHPAPDTPPPPAQWADRPATSPQSAWPALGSQRRLAPARAGRRAAHPHPTRRPCSVQRRQFSS